MSRDQLLGELAAVDLSEGNVAYVARRGDDYTWALEGPDAPAADRGPLPDAWIYYSGPWPAIHEARAPFVEDLLAEMESMTGTGDRCRWPLEHPWQHAHSLQRINDDDEPRDGMQDPLVSSILREPFTSPPPSKGDGP